MQSVGLDLVEAFLLVYREPLSVHRHMTSLSNSLSSSYGGVNPLRGSTFIKSSDIITIQSPYLLVLSHWKL